MTPSPTPAAPFWRPQRIHQLYRILLGLLLSTLLAAMPDMLMESRGNLSLYVVAVGSYLVFALVAPLADALLERLLGPWGALPGILIEILLITLMVFSNGGGPNNLYILLIVTVATGSILLPGKGSYLVASLATLGVLSEHLVAGSRWVKSDYHNITEAGFYGISFFVTALVINLIVRKLQQSEQLAQEQERQILRLEALNQQIVQRMRTAVLVFDERRHILLANKAAEELLGEQPSPTLVPDSIQSLYVQWKNTAQQSRLSIQLQPGGPVLMVRFAELKQDSPSPTLAFLEDQRQLAQEAQQLKLASLGRLSATIAHEIRNPLSAINHAADLLAESIDNPGDQKLLGIITNNVARVNGIITDIMNLSRRQASAAERLNLLSAVQDVVTHWLDQGKKSEQFQVEISPNIDIKFDPAQLSQILHNLVFNAFHHGGAEGRIQLRAGLHPTKGTPWLRLRDHGPGVPPPYRDQLFDPFFTTSRQGTGLGLYVCKELCEANQAQIDFVPRDDGAEFVITFAHPDRNFS